jgi:hypothetical protein
MGSLLSGTMPAAFQTPATFRQIAVLYFTVDIGATGAPTLDEAASSLDVTITRDAAGDYDITFPTGGRFVAWAGGSIDPDDDGPAGDGSIPALLDPDLDAGTAKIIVRAGDDGLATDPADGSVLRFKMEIAL